MSKNLSLDLSDDEFQSVAVYAHEEQYQPDSVIFSEGDKADTFYIIERGSVSITISKSGKQEEINRLSAGDFFGELALLDKDRRVASAAAVENVTLWVISNDEFIQLMASHPQLAEKLTTAAQNRRDELLLKEQLVSTTGVGETHLHVSLKGDPSLRETAFTRERYESIVDQILPKLVPALRTILFETVVFRIFIGLNNAEVRLHTAINPFIEEVHTADKIVLPAYIKRHFAPMDYETKRKLMYGTTEFIEQTDEFKALPGNWRHILDTIQDDWRPIERKQLEIVLDRLTDMRKMQNFYLRNFSLSMAQDAIRMQFNCDGTHIVSSADYARFLEDNIILS